MRLTLAAATLAATAALTLAGGGAAMAATTDSVPVVVPTASSVATGSTTTGSTTTGSTTTGDTTTGSTTTGVVTGTVVEPGTLILGAGSATPGSQITFSGSLPTQGGPGFPTLETVTSPAFAGPAHLDRTNPDAFDGTATIAAGTAPGTYEVYATGSQGGVSARLVVTGAPTPTPPHGGGSGQGGSGQGSHVVPGTAHVRTHDTGATGATDADGGTSAPTSAPLPAEGIDLVSSESGSGWVLPVALGGLAVTATAAAGAYAVGRRRTDSRTRPSQGGDTPTERIDTNWR